MLITKIETFDNDWFVLSQELLQKVHESMSDWQDFLKIGTTIIKKTNIKKISLTEWQEIDLIMYVDIDSELIKRSYRENKKVSDNETKAVWTILRDLYWFDTSKWVSRNDFIDNLVKERNKNIV